MRNFYATCHHCHTLHVLGKLEKQGVHLEPSTNYREEDTVHFVCPTCNKKVDGAIVLGDR